MTGAWEGVEMREFLFHCVSAIAESTVGTLAGELQRDFSLRNASPAFRRRFRDRCIAVACFVIAIAGCIYLLLL